jgi:hypothetical protein
MSNATRSFVFTRSSTADRRGWNPNQIRRVSSRGGRSVGFLFIDLPTSIVFGHFAPQQASMKGELRDMSRLFRVDLSSQAELFRFCRREVGIWLSGKGNCPRCKAPSRPASCRMIPTRLYVRWREHFLISAARVTPMSLYVR